VVVFEPGIRGVNLHPKDSELALDEMKKAGARIGNSLLDGDQNQKLPSYFSRNEIRL
jgi:hypothetical protein